MASKIRVMPEQLANQIAAGEVVERPASVVKELIENSLDAQAARIVVETEDGGRSLIRVTDDGCGMSPDDALLSLERHATSKIRTEADLWKVSTLGFRGEALPAIASVSRLVLATRERGALAGTRVRAEGGEVKEVNETGLPEGTWVEIRDLFYNVPARRKFLRSPKTELANLIETIVRLAIWRPGVYFELRDNGKEALRVAAAESIPERIGALLGREVLSHLFHFGQEFTYFSLEGYASNPDYHRGSAKNIFPYVNMRHVRDRLLVNAVNTAYRDHLLKGSYPVAVINLTLAPELVDVNAHPTKAEVRFRQPAGVFEGLQKALSMALSARFGVPQGHNFLGRFGRSTSAFEPSDREGDKLPSPISGAAESDLPRDAQAEWFNKETIKHTPTRFDIEFRTDQPDPDVGKFSGLAIIGQLADSYIVCENRHSTGSLLLIDQHAAHERINYERLRHAIAASAVEVQNLLLPITLELRPVESGVLETIVDELAQAGVIVVPFGEGSWRIEAAPAMLNDSETKSLVLDCLDHVRETGTLGRPEKRIEEIIILTACHASVKAGQALTLAQMREILRGLDACEQPTNCPHGRPTAREYPLDEIERAFARR